MWPGLARRIIMEISRRPRINNNSWTLSTVQTRATKRRIIITHQQPHHHHRNPRRRWRRWTEAKEPEDAGGAWGPSSGFPCCSSCPWSFGRTTPTSCPSVWVSPIFKWLGVPSCRGNFFFHFWKLWLTWLMCQSDKWLSLSNWIIVYVMKLLRFTCLIECLQLNHCRINLIPLSSFTRIT